MSGQILEHLGVQVSMSGKGNCYNHAPIESFWGTLKQELIHHRHYTSRRRAMQEITEYIKILYNSQRLHEKLGFPLPASYFTLGYLLHERIVVYC